MGWVDESGAVRSQRAFELELAAQLPALFRFAASLSSRNDAEDVVQDALARAWVKRERYDPARGPLQSWLLAIVADQARGRWRRSRPIWTVIEAPATTDPEKGGVTADLQHAIAALPPRQRAAIVLHHFVDLPVAQVAELMRCFPRDGQVHLARCPQGPRTSVGRVLCPRLTLCCRSRALAGASRSTRGWRALHSSRSPLIATRGVAQGRGPRRWSAPPRAAPVSS